MSTHTLGLYLHHLALSDEVGCLGDASDKDLLSLYEAGQSEPAFTELMRRHGPMVLRICRRVLGRGQDAEDAFQATFLLLARKAAQLRGEAGGPLSLGGWLHRVAYRTALNAMAQSVRRKNHERHAANMNPLHVDPEMEASWNEVRPIIDAELDALPDEPRRLLIACYLQSKTHAETAAALGVPLGSVAGRLEKAKALLADRLARRGVVLSVPLLAAHLGAAANGAVVPAKLFVHSIEAVMIFAEQTSGTVSGTVAQLVKIGLTNMPKNSTGMGFIFAGTAALLAAGVIACQTLLAVPDKKADGDQPPAAAVVEHKPQANKTELVDRYGDALPPGAVARLGTVRFRNSPGGGGYRSVRIAGGGQGYVTAGPMSAPSLWDGQSGKLVRRFGVAQRQGQPIAISPDGKTLAGIDGVSGHLHLWEIATGKVLTATDVKLGDLSRLVFSADGTRIAASAVNNKLYVWDTTLGLPRWVVTRNRHVSTIAFGAEDKTLAVVEGKAVVEGHVLSFWDAATGDQRPGQLDLERAVVSTSVSPDGRTMVLEREVIRKDRDYETDVAILDLATFQIVRQLVPNKGRRFQVNPIQALAVASGGKVLAEANGGGEVRLWDAGTGQVLRRCQGDRCFVDTMAFSADGKSLVGLDRGRVRVWDTATGKEALSNLVGHDQAVTSLTFLPDGTLVSNGWDGVARLWDATSGEERQQIPPTATMDGYVPVGEASAAAGDGKTLTLLDLFWPTGQENFVAVVRTWDRGADRERGRHVKQLGDAPPQSLVVSPDGKVVGCAGGQLPGNEVHLWDAATGNLIAKAAGLYPAFSPDGKFLATVLGNREQQILSIRDAATGKEVCSAPAPQGSAFTRLAFSPQNNALISLSESGLKNTVHFWPLSPGEPAASGPRVGPPRVLVDDAQRGVRTLAFSPDGRTFALPGDDGSVRVVETATGKERVAFAGHTGPVWSLAFSADCRRLATGSSDTTVLVWDVTGRLQNGQLRPAELAAREREELWAELASDGAARAQRSLWALAADPLGTVPFLAKQLQATVKRVEPEVIAKHIRDLDDQVFTTREKAYSELKLLGEIAEPALRAALKDAASPEVQRRIEDLLLALDAHNKNPSGLSLRGVRAVEVLEQIGTPDARKILKDLAAGAAGSSVTRDTRAALERLRTEK
ncbi:sigma-70 family RNA polymerase sigma factor [Fimbriiglobus ruber]|uniref:High-affnity carbon uptake protein Hat/HatR n=1 Tax=Fimbriiglobus ruber TaxID=1908690 RepID=A0A225DET0_9BACT|nr:sigma-70 family RNA polymerase sigma factor [Fimbriiglobus ruber]OWK35659.1 High-affnity carbon uptake protein Hat/HatR [Fimbriiglobus ruber]